MTALKSLTFTAIPKTSNNPTLKRRTKTIARLEEQKLLLKDPSHVRITQKWTGKGETRKQVEKRQRVLPWWRLDQNGSYVFAIRSGGRAVEFDKGKAGIAVQSLEKLPAVIDTLLAAVRGGELDEQLAKISKERTVPKPPRKAA